MLLPGCWLTGFWASWICTSQIGLIYFNLGFPVHSVMGRWFLPDGFNPRSHCLAAGLIYGLPTMVGFFSVSIYLYLSHCIAKIRCLLPEMNPLLAGCAAYLLIVQRPRARVRETHHTGASAAPAPVTLPSSPGGPAEARSKADFSIPLFRITSTASFFGWSTPLRLSWYICYAHFFGGRKARVLARNFIILKKSSYKALSCFCHTSKTKKPAKNNSAI